jgi:hypothetical protein
MLGYWKQGGFMDEIDSGLKLSELSELSPLGMGPI